MPTDLTLPRLPAEGESYLWLFPSTVNLIPSIAGLVGDGSVFRVGPDVSGGGPVPFSFGTLSDYNANSGNAPGGSGKVYVSISHPLHWGGGLVWGNFDASALPAGATISDVYGVVSLDNATVGYPDISTIDLACGRLSPSVAEAWNYDGSGGANHDSAVISVPSPSGTTGPSGQYSNGTGIHAPIDPATGRVDWSIFSICARLFQSLSGSPDQTLTVNGVAAVVYFTGGFPKLAIGHGCNLNSYNNRGFLDPQFPPGLGELLWDVEPSRNWCRANDISISNNQDSQRLARDIAEDLLRLCNSAPVLSGGWLKTIPWDEVSGAGNGKVYVADTQPQFRFTDRDFIRDGDNPPVVISRPRRVNCDNVISIEHIDRTKDYAHTVTSEVDDMSVALYGPRKSGTGDGSQLSMRPRTGSLSLLWLHSREIAQKIASIAVKVSAAGDPEIAFTVGAQHMHREAMDIGTIDEPTLGWSNYPIRLKSVKEDPGTGNVAITAEPFVYARHHPDVRGTSKATGTLVQDNVDPGIVNDPIIFEPPAAMLAVGSGPQLFILVSGADRNYGGCVAFVSVDGGVSYPTSLGNIGPAITGALTADYPSHADPDSADVLAVDLSESNGELVSQSPEIADGFADPCYIAGASGSIGVPFEVVCPTSVTTTGIHEFSMDTYIRRAVQGTELMDHPIGTRFGVINGQVLKIDIPPQWIGKTVYFKFPAYNKLKSQQGDLTNCTAYPYTITGGPSAEVYVDGVAVSFDDVVYVDGVLVSGSPSFNFD